MNCPTVILPGHPGEPRVELLDARILGLEAPELRERTRALSPKRAAFISRSYRHPYALIVLHDTPVGIDIERIEICEPAFARSICTPGEAHDSGSVAHRDRYFTSMWSSKEALAKALGDPLSYDPRRLDAPMHWPGGRAGAWRSASCPRPSRCRRSRR
jgi:hypothetical protein